MSSKDTVLRLATRRSPLARWQAGEVARLLRTADPGLEVELVAVDTSGDRRQDLPVWELAGQGVFVKEVQGAVLAGRADAAVHSAKDLPSTTAPGLDLAAFPVRGDVRDALVGSRLDDLPPGATVATGSVRRRVQLAWLRPDLTFASLRGNIATRLDRVPDGGAAVVAYAALQRLDLAGRATEVLEPSVLLPQVGQGATAGLLATIDDAATRAEVEAERAMLATLGGGCDTPVGALARVRPDGQLQLEGMLATADGRIVLRRTEVGPLTEPAKLGARLAAAFPGLGEQ